MNLAIVLALVAAVAYGAGDFAAGLATRRAGSLAVTAGSQLIGLVPLLTLLLVQRPAALTPALLGWGVLAGFGNVGGTVSLYRGLANGRMGVVAPLSGVVAAGLPVAVGLLLGERPSAMALAGIGIALVAIVLVSLAHEDRRSHTRSQSGVLDGLGAGVGFALLFVALERAGTGHGVWPLVLSSATTVLVLAIVAAVTRARLLPEREHLGSVALVGTLGMIASLSYLAATGHGLLALVVVLTSLYPAVTVILAAMVLRERSTRVQIGGMVCAAAAVVLIVVGSSS